jgi:hypothetical protein
MKNEQATRSEARSTPLKSGYNSISISVILVIAAILAVILILWPSGGF